MRSTKRSDVKIYRVVVLALAFFLAVGWLVSTTTQASITITVTTTADNGNDANPTPGSLRKAIITSNNTAGVDTIKFSIGTGAKTIAPPTGLPIITDPVIIDGTTQPGFAGTPIIELNGQNAVGGYPGLQINSGDCTVRGLVINRFMVGIFITAKGNNVIKGNYIGTDKTGTVDLGNSSHGINVQSAAGNTIGGTTTADRNVISGNDNNGLRLSGGGSNTVFGNYIGVDASGSAPLGNSNQSVRLENSSFNVIGGTGQGQGNIISGGFDLGMVLISAFENTITGNRIGTDITGTLDVGNKGGGIVVLSGTGNKISSNSIAFNGKLGIDLDIDTIFPVDGVTPNDTNDGDSGSNELQNYPVITSVKRFANSTQIAGTLNSKANTTFRLEFFSNAQCDASGFGEGQKFLGGANVSTSGNNASFNVTLPVAVPASDSVTATATDPLGNTSEFSKCAGGQPTPSLSISDVTKTEGNFGTKGFVFNVTLSAASGQTVTVNYATAGGTAQSGVDFQPKSGPLSFAPGQTAKTVTVIVNGDKGVENDELFSVFLANPTGATIADNQGDGTIVNDDAAPPPPSVQFGQASYTVNEGQRLKTIKVTRTGVVSAASTVDYQTADLSAGQRTDYTILLGTLSFAPGETSKTLTLLVTEDSYVEGDEALTLSLSNPAGATLGGLSVVQVTITDNDSDPNAANAIDGVPNFVRQHYHDFLNREPDPAGFAGWKDVLNQCASGDTKCDRIEVSSAFFRSEEFHDRGYFIYRFYAAALDRIPTYLEFMRDLQKVSGFLTPQQLEDAKAQFTEEFMQRSEFKQQYDQLAAAAAYVDALSASAGVTLQNRNQLVQQLQTNQITRGQALRAVVESAEVDQEFFNEAFVATQYFGYLRRDPDAAYLQWIEILEQTGDYRVLVNGFLNSTEYRQRFGK